MNTFSTTTFRNCSHLNSGWCLKCVSDEFRKIKDLKECIKRLKVIGKRDRAEIKRLKKK